MEIERKKGPKLWIVDRTPSCSNFTVKAKRLYREVLVFIENNPHLKGPFAQTETKDEIVRTLKNI